jgi:molybdopterin converting factor small subunit
MKVRIPTPLQSYTGAMHMVDASGSTVAEVLADLDAQFPGIRFRMIDEQEQLRQHMNIFVGRERTRDLSTSLEGVDEVVIMQALSGG